MPNKIRPEGTVMRRPATDSTNVYRNSKQHPQKQYHGDGSTPHNVPHSSNAAKPTSVPKPTKKQTPKQRNHRFPGKYRRFPKINRQFPTKTVPQQLQHCTASPRRDPGGPRRSNGPSIHHDDGVPIPCKRCPLLLALRSAPLRPLTSAIPYHRTYWSDGWG